MSALIGLHIDKINLAATMLDLNIDNNEPCLTTIEKNATVLDLLRSRYGIYHSAVY